MTEKDLQLNPKKSPSSNKEPTRRIRSRIYFRNPERYEMDKKEEPMTYSDAVSKAASAIYRFPLIEVEGIPLRSWIANSWSLISAFQPDPSDLLIATYPKAGMTWTQEIVDLLLHDGDAEVCKRAPTDVRIPFLEIQSPPPIPSGLDLLKTMKPPRVIKTHLPIQLVPKGFWENKCKVIYVARNAKDNLVSYYHFDRMNQIHPEPGPWDQYIHKFMRGKLPWGSWYDHVKGYWREKENRNILYLIFEEIKEERPGLRRLWICCCMTEMPRFVSEHLLLYASRAWRSNFLHQFLQVIYVARNAKDNLVSYYHFDRMNQTQPEPGPWDQYIHKFMKGKLPWGSWYDHVKGYWREKENRNILYLFFEDIKENPHREILRIMRYLDLSLPDDIIDKIVQLTSFEVMKDNPMANYTFIPNTVFDSSISLFMRKGEVGDWINHFTPAQSKMFDEDYTRQMADVDIPFRTSI